MKTFIIILSGCLFFIACQRSVSDINNRTINTEDSIVTAGDLLTYEVLTTDTVGWFGVWNQSNGILTGNAFDSVTYGSPVYLHTDGDIHLKLLLFPSRHWYP